jgi:predicted porin
MKKILYGTTALVAAGLAAGQAEAASGLKLGITGFYRGAAGMTIGGESVQTAPNSGQGAFGRTNGGFRQEIRINFTGETTLDNGLTIGVLVGLNGENLIGVGSTTTPVKQSWVDFKGKFGDVRFGEFTGALGQDCVVDPGNVTSNFGINSPNESFSDGGRGVNSTRGNRTVGVAPFGSIGTCYGIESRGTKIAYFTPSFGGFTMAVSYAPSGSTRNPGGGYFYGSDIERKNAMNVLSVGADYNHDFGGVALTVGGGGEWALDSYTGFGGSRPSSERPASYQLGFQLGLPGGFAVGASGAYMQNYSQAGYAATNAAPSDDGWIATVGGSYTIDAVSIGLQGLYSKWEVLGDSGNDKIWGVSLNSSYALGPGISLEGQVAYQKYDAAFAASYSTPASYDAVEIDAGFAINF